MAETVTLEEVEELVAQLAPSERLKLVAHICQKLGVKPPAAHDPEAEEDQARRERTEQADVLLAELDAIADSIDGEFDSAADIRDIREGRANRA